MGAHVRAKFKVSSIILTSFRQGVILPPTTPRTSKRNLKKPTRIRTKTELFSHKHLILDVDWF